MKQLIIIRGPAGVGKTTISKLLSDKIHFAVVHFDEIMDELGMDYIEGEKWIPLEKFLKADETMIPKFVKVMEEGKGLIIDGNFYHREHIEDILHKIDFPSQVFTLKAGLQECIRRDSKRKAKLGERAISDVFGLVSQFDYGDIVETDNRTPGDVVNEILSKITALL